MTRARVRTGMLGLVACATLVLGACAQSNTPTEYNDLTQQNFLETCTNLYYENTDNSVTWDDPTSDTVVADADGASPAVCQCSYEVFTNNMSIQDFTTLNNDLKDDAQSTWDALPQNIKDGLADCDEDGGSTGPSTTSTTAAATTDDTAG